MAVCVNCISLPFCSLLFFEPCQPFQIDQMIIHSITQVNLNITNMDEVEGHIWAKFQSLVRTKRGRLHDHYKAYVGGAKAKCKRNTLNRSNLKHPHNQGPNAFVPSLHEMKAREKVKGNDNFTKMDFYKHTRSKDGKWINTNVEKAHGKMEAKFDESKDIDHPINGDEAFHGVVGTKSSDSASLGHGPPPPTKRATIKETLEQNERYRKLEEQNNMLL